MALRQAIPGFDPALDRLVGGESVVPRLAQPKSVGFRAGADLTSLISEIKSSKSVRVDAAVGAGKTVKLPGEIAKAMGIMVLHVFPSQFLAADVAKYVASVGIQCEFIQSPSDPLPDTGVVCVSAAALVARWLQAGMVCLPKCVLYHDEVHESDVYTYLVRTLSATCSELVCYVAATATIAPGGFRQPELSGTLIKAEYSKDLTSDTWDIYGEGPWSVYNLVKGHTLIYEDDKSRADRLMVEYQEAGYMVYRFHARMKLEVFEMAMEFLRTTTTRMVVVIADYSFRSGYTMPVSVIIDTAKVMVLSADTGKPSRIVRAAYELERYQAMGRGARVAGLVTHYYSPDDIAPMKICDLEATEVEAASLLLRLLGYKPPREFAGAVLSSGEVPRNLVAALQGQAPLALMSPMQKVPIAEFFQPKGRRSPFLREEVDVNAMPGDLDPGTSADVARKHGVAGLKLGNYGQSDGYDSRGDSHDVPRPLEVTKDVRGHSDFRDSLVTTADALEALASYKEKVDVMVVGSYYYAAGLYSDSYNSSAFPDGYESVMRWMGSDRTGVSYRGLSDRNRSVAINALLMRYNVRTVELHALSKVLPGARTRAVGKDLGSVREWARAMGERLSKVMAELHVVADYLTKLSDGTCSLVEMDALKREEDAVIKSMNGELDAMPSACIGPPEAFMRQLRLTRDQDLPDLVPSNASDSSSGGSRGGSITGRFDDVEMPTTGRGMRAGKHKHASAFLSWTAGNTSKGAVVDRDKGRFLRNR